MQTPHTTRPPEPSMTPRFQLRRTRRHYHLQIGIPDPTQMEIGILYRKTPTGGFPGFPPPDFPHNGIA